MMLSSETFEASFLIGDITPMPIVLLGVALIMEVFWVNTGCLNFVDSSPATLFFSIPPIILTSCFPSTITSSSFFMLDSPNSFSLVILMLSSDCWERELCVNDLFASDTAFNPPRFYSAYYLTSDSYSLLYSKNLWSNDLPTLYKAFWVLFSTMFMVDALLKVSVDDIFFSNSLGGNYSSSLSSFPQDDTEHDKLSVC